MIKFTGAIITAVFVVLFVVVDQCKSEANLPLHWKINYSVASWYGHEFHGKKTASGETFDMNAFTCAHRTYPFGTWLKITNIMNNKSTFCVVNDRGPFKAFRGLDLSFAAANFLDIISLGLCTVRVEYAGFDASYMKKLREIIHDPVVSLIWHHRLK